MIGSQHDACSQALCVTKAQFVKHLVVTLLSCYLRRYSAFSTSTSSLLLAFGVGLPLMPCRDEGEKHKKFSIVKRRFLKDEIKFDKK